MKWRRGAALALSLAMHAAAFLALVVVATPVGTPPRGRAALSVALVPPPPAAASTPRIVERAKRRHRTIASAACARAPVANTPTRVDALPPEKRRDYDAVQAAYQIKHALTPVGMLAPLGAYGVVSGERWAGPPGGHPPGFVCSPLLLFKSAKNQLPPHSLELGPCLLTPPAGIFTEEADLPSHVDLPREDR